jgi:hypothetical protein
MLCSRRKTKVKKRTKKSRSEAESVKALPIGRSSPRSVKGWKIAVCWLARSGAPAPPKRFQNGSSPRSSASRATLVHGASCVKTMPVFACAATPPAAFHGYALNALGGMSTRSVKSVGAWYAAASATKSATSRHGTRPNQRFQTAATPALQATKSAAVIARCRSTPGAPATRA